MQLSNPGQLFWARQHSCWSNGKLQVESAEENGEDMGQILVLIRFEASWKKPFR
jgi:hypothetical protein